MAKTVKKVAAKAKIQEGDALLRSAIATAKSVKAVSLANAKLALQEAFNGKLQSLYATKVKEAMEDEDEGVEGDFSKEEPDELATGFDQGEKRQDPTVVHKNEAKKPKKEGKDATNDQGADPEKEKGSAVGPESGSDTATSSGKSKYVPAVYEEEVPGQEEEVPGEEVPGEEGGEVAPEGDIEVPEEPGEEVSVDVQPAGEEGEEEVAGEEDEEDEDAVELEAIIKELEAEEGELNTDEPFAGEETPGEEEKEKEMGGLPEGYEEDTDEAKDITADQGADPEKETAGAVAPDAGSGSETAKETNPTTDADPVGQGGGKPFGQGPGAEEEELDLENLVKEIEGEMGAEGEEGEEEKEKEFDMMKNENVRLTKSLKEHRKVVVFLKNKLNEINLLNGKLLYSNKLFRSASLTEAQKLRVIEAIDRANTLREVKLVYATLAESFKVKGSKINESKKPARATASKPTGSTKPTVLTEGQDLAARFKQLSGAGSKKIVKFL